MKKYSVMLTVFSLLFLFHGARSEEIDNTDDLFWNNQSPTGIELDQIEIRAFGQRVNDFKKEGRQTLGGPGTGPGTSNYCMDAYTAPTWATNSPSVFSVEQYSFSFATVDHRVVIRNAMGPWPTPIGLAFAWQLCGNSKIYPPMPRTYGLAIDGNTLVFTLPYSGIWYITSNFDNFIYGTYDWIFMARFDGVSPIPSPIRYPPTDVLGGDVNEYNKDNSLHNVTDAIGDGQGSGRPWCFSVR